MDRSERLVYLACILVVSCFHWTAAAVETEIEPVQSWTNVFAGEEVTQSFRLNRLSIPEESVGWSVLLDSAVIRRSESPVKSDPQHGPVFAITFKVPDGDARVQLPISILVSTNGKDVLAKRLWVYPKDPFQRPLNLAATDELVVFDPAGKTADRLKSLNLKFRVERNLEAMSRLKSGLLIAGEGVSFREHRGLSRVLLAAAQRGVRVLCLAPSAGSVLLSDDIAAGKAKLESASTNGESPIARPVQIDGILTSLIFRQADVLHTFDKHLDSADWRTPASIFGPGLRISTKAGQTSVEINEGSSEWAWVDAGFVGGGRLVITNLQMIEHWDAGPAPRYALWHSLKQIISEPETKSVAPVDARSTD